MSDFLEGHMIYVKVLFRVKINLKYYQLEYQILYYFKSVSYNDNKEAFI